MNVIFQSHSLIDRNVILHLHSIADMHKLPDKYILSERTVLADTRPGPKMAKMPYFRPCANFDVVINIAAFVYKNTFHLSDPFPSSALARIYRRKNSPNDKFLFFLCKVW